MSEMSELDRLQALVGPSETAYEQLRDDRDAAERAARDAELEAGELRGRIVEMGVQVSRARQDQDVLQRRIEMSPTERILDRFARRWSNSIMPRLTRRS